MRLVLISIIALLLFSCGKGTVFSEYKSVDSEGWKKEDKKVFEAEITDTKSGYDVFVNVRHADTYMYSNIYLFLTTVYPDGKQVQDTLECVLADAENHWTGNGAGDLWDKSVVLKRNVQFPMSGKYKFIFEHGMRTDPLPQVMDIGLTIQNAEK